VGQSVTIHEVTTLQNGTVVFNSRTKGIPVTFLRGGSQVIAGVDEGVRGLRVGEKRRLLVPPTLSVRAMYPSNTPRDSTLIIDVELMGIRSR
jgi:FKBP-type peptidyl-prolyl cis-trans isomerase